MNTVGPKGKWIWGKAVCNTSVLKILIESYSRIPYSFSEWFKTWKKTRVRLMIFKG